MKNKRTCALITFALITASIRSALAATESVFPSGSGVVTVVNNFIGTNDTIIFDGRYFSKGDIVKVYSDSSKTKEIGLQTVNEYQDDVIISTDQLGQTSGSVYVTLQEAQNDESNVLKVDYDPEVTAINNVDKADTVTFKGLKAKDIAKVYSADGGTLLGQSTATSDGDVTVTLSNQLSESDLSVKVTVTSGSIESPKIIVNYPKNAKTDHPIWSSEVDGNTVVVSNNANIADAVTFKGLKAKDIAKVYDKDKTTVLGQAAAVKDGELVVTLANQLDESTKEIYVTVKGYEELESDQTLVRYFREEQSKILDSIVIVATNNAVGTEDTVFVTGLSVGDIVKVYSPGTDGKVIGTAIVATGETSATVKIPQLGTTSGSVYVSVTSTGKLESDKKEVTYVAEEKSTPLNDSSIKVTNNITGTADTVEVTGLEVGDIVKVYSSETDEKAIGTATAVTGETSATGKASATVKIPQLGTEKGNVYVSVTSKGKLESERIKTIEYAAEEKSTTPNASSITVKNNTTGTVDTVEVTGLAVGDIVKVYSPGIDGKVIGTAKVATGETSATVKIKQLGTTAGSVSVSVTSTGKLESVRTAKEYAEEVKSTTPNGTILVTNNSVGTPDTVVVPGLQVGDIVKVYSVATDGKAIGTAKVATGETSATVKIKQLGTAEGNVYVSLTSTGKLESDRTEVKYNAEVKSTTPNGTIEVKNNSVGTADTVVVSSLAVGDIVKVYSSGTGGKAIGTAKVAKGETSATVKIKQLGTAEGNVYVSLTSTGKLESDRTEVKYDAEVKSTTPNGTKVVTNNSVGTADTVVVSSLAVGDIVKVYSSGTGGKAIGTAKVAKGETLATVKIKQLGTAEGNVYVSLTSTGKLESDRTEVKYDAEVKSTTPNGTKVVTNNSVGTADTVVVSSLAVGDIVKVYSSGTGGKAIGTAKVAKGETSATVKIKQLGTAEGNVYVSLTSTGKLESDRTEVKYNAEVKSTKPNGTIEVKNNKTGTADTVVVSGLAVGDIVKVYSAEAGGKAIGTAKVAKGQTSATVKIKQLGTAEGKAYVSVTSKGKLESDRATVIYYAEP